MSIPSVTELTLLKCLWRQQPLSARELHDQVAGELDWSYSSTRKTLERMVEKRMVTLQAAHGVNVYRAALEKIETLGAFARDFGRRVMEMNVNHAELAELEQLLHDWPEDKEST